MAIKFYSQKNRSTNLEYPCIEFYKDSWDDYSWVITYSATFKKSYQETFELGQLKILDKTTNVTEISESFNNLTSDQCSLGQSLEYYENIKKYFPDNFEEILKSLNDVAINDSIRKEFEEESGFISAMLRFSSASRALEDAKLLLFENITRVTENLAFSYSVKLPEADKEHTATFDFAKTDKFPYRINVIIGKNGTGKTQFLGKMVNSISGVDRLSGFSPSTPRFNKIISISYSLFDDFPKPEETTVFSYKYIGLRTSEEEIISDSKLSEKLKKAFFNIQENGRQYEWFSIVNKIIPLENLGLTDFWDLDKTWIENISYEKSKRLSSGQSIMLFILTELIANIQKETLILFDEPETHLHPTAIAQLMTCFTEILETYESFAILSTHSPIILQDVPAKYVKIFDRINNLPIIKSLELESFGENLSILTNSVFETVNIKELYKTHLDKLNEQFMSKEQINLLFNNRLSFNAQLYLEALTPPF